MAAMQLMKMHACWLVLPYALQVTFCIIKIVCVKGHFVVVWCYHFAL